MASPSLIIRRLVVDGDLTTDLRFERGLNIIRAVETGGDPRSTNKCGKTSLVELIQHGLGRRQKSKSKFHFAPIIDRINKLWLEIETNQQILTIERSLQEINARARIREGTYVSGIENTPFELVNIEDMSSLLMKSLDIPEVSVKTAEGDLSPLTFPTLMRAFILHQEDSFGAILDKVLPLQRRSDIIGFITQITPLGRFTIEDQLSEVQLRAQELETYFNSVQEFLNRNGIPSLIEAEARVREAEANLQSALKTQRNIQTEIHQNVTSQSSNQAGRLDGLRHQILNLKEEKAKIERTLTGLWHEEERLKEVLSSLKVDRQKTKRVFASSTILNSVKFGICPRCLLEITPEMRQREQYARCSLCNRPLRTTSDTPPKVTPRLEDINFQIDETEDILKDVQKEIEFSQIQLRRLHTSEEEASQELDAETQIYISPAVDQLLARAREVSGQEAELARARALYDQAIALNSIRDQLKELKQSQADLEVKLRESRKPDKSRLESFRQIYEDILIRVEFPNLRNCKIDTQTLMPYINGNLYIHTGTAFKGLATVAYHLALLELARRVETFFPRILVIDSPAVGDLNDENHDKLLRYLSGLQSNIEDIDSPSFEELDWQIILTTRRITNEIEKYVIDEISAPNRMLLR